MNALKVITTLIAALAPMMYFHGEAFHHGLLSYWGLPAGLFTLSLEDTLTSGFIVYAILGIPQLALLFMCLIVAVLVLYNVHEISKFTLTKKLVGHFIPKKSVKDENDGNQWVRNVLARTVVASLLAASVLAVLISAILVHEKANSAGREFGKTQHHNLSAASSLAAVHTKEKILEGRIIMCGTSFCALLVSEDIVVVPADNIKAIKYELPNKLVKDAPLGR